MLPRSTTCPGHRQPDCGHFPSRKRQPTAKSAEVRGDAASFKVLCVHCFLAVSAVHGHFFGGVEWTSRMSRLGQWGLPQRRNPRRGTSPAVTMRAQSSSLPAARQSAGRPLRAAVQHPGVEARRRPSVNAVGIAKARPHPTPICPRTRRPAGQAGVLRKAARPRPRPRRCIFAGGPEECASADCRLQRRFEPVSRCSSAIRDGRIGRLELLTNHDPRSGSAPIGIWCAARATVPRHDEDTRFRHGRGLRTRSLSKYLLGKG